LILFKKFDEINFHPLSLSKKISSLKSGIYSLNKRVNFKNLPNNLNFEFRNNLIDIDLSQYKKNKSYYDGDKFLFSVNEKNYNKKNIEKIQFEGNYIMADHIWDYLNHAGKMIKKDSKIYKKNNKIKDLKNINFEIIGRKKDLVLNENTKVFPGVIFDTTNGPIIIDDGSVIKPYSYIKGPAYIGKNSTLDDCKIRENTSIGDVCKISGEVENSIISSYTNKHHGGFIGHSYIGSWVNLGAFTTNSDLKNNYGNVKVNLTGNEEINTKKLKVGSFIGDHVKTGIGTLLNTGTYIGFGALLYGGGVFPKFIPSFSWADNNSWDCYKIDKFINNEKKVMKRRSVNINNEYKEMIRAIYKKTEIEREEGVRLWET